MENQIIVSDSLNTIRQIIEVNVPQKENTIFYIIHSCTTLLIALVNLGLLIYIFKRNSAKLDLNHEKTRKINLLKVLVLDYNMEHLYYFFDEIGKVSEGLKVPNLQTENKQAINDHLIGLGKSLRQRFTDTLLAIDKSLYDKFIENSDSLLDGLTHSIFDEGVNLTHEPKFEELITNKISVSKTNAIKILFEYSGE